MAQMKEMTAGPSLPLIFNFTLPLLLGNALQQTYSLVDAAIVGKFLGINALASVGASTSVVFLILGFCNGCCGGFAIPVAQKFGARDYLSMRRFVSVSLKLAVVMSVAVAVITSLLCAFILRSMQTPDNIFEGAYYYLLITFIGVPCTFFYNLLSSIIRALGDSKTPFWFLLFATVLNIILDLFCILVLGWGVAGAAIATVVSQGLSALLCYRYMYRKFDILRTTPSDRKFRTDLAKQLLSIGMPMGLQFSITAIGSIMLQSANNALGTACVAAFTAAMRIKMFFMCALDSLGMAMATYSGQNYGAGKPDRIWQGIKSAVLMMIIYIAVVDVIIWLWVEDFATLFIDSSETEVLTYTARFLHINVCFFPLLGLLSVLRYSIQGAGYTKLAMFSGVSEMVARILVSVIAVPLWGFWGVCFGDPTAWLFANLFLVPAFIYVYRQLHVIVARQQVV
ncbi:MATE family efflux transporter [uncultured Bacteroides sp.]|jgi:putative MATE family efflux protein|uniref:MATE family efflux transporter n=1 Tax=uncultured Bacteroides sp. TaxID=162156 RepID=UPI00280B11B2|nr:MATE family efflux transporter [uncultured Bacteroides sp.]